MTDRPNPFVDLAPLPIIGAPIGAGFMAWALDRDDAPLRAALERRPAVVSITFGALDRHVALAREAGIPVVTQVGDLDDLAAEHSAGSA